MKITSTYISAAFIKEKDLNIKIDFGIAIKKQNSSETNIIVIYSNIKINFVNNEYEIKNITAYDVDYRNYINENYDKIKFLLEKVIKNSELLKKIEIFLSNLKENIEVKPNVNLLIRKSSINSKIVYKIEDNYEIRYYFSNDGKKIINICAIVNHNYERKEIDISRFFSEGDYDILISQMFRNKSIRLKLLV